MGSYRIALIPGDGAGVEVVDEGVKVMDAVAGQVGNLNLDYVRFDWGSDYYRRHGRMMPEDGIDQLSNFDAIYLGAVGWPDIQDYITLNGLLLPIRRAFDPVRKRTTGNPFRGGGLTSFRKKSRGDRPCRDAGEYRGGVFKRRGTDLPRKRARGGHPIRRFHPEGDGTDHPICLRSRQDPERNEESNLHYEIQRSGFWNGLLG